MPRYNLAAPEGQIIVTWLFEPNGYLDYAVRVSDGQTARQALAADPDLDVTQWVRDNELTEPEAEETGMVWWIWKNNQVNISPPNRPPEAAGWVSILDRWVAQIIAALANDPGGARRNNEGTGRIVYDETGTEVGYIPSGSDLTHQRTMANKVIGVLG